MERRGITFAFVCAAVLVAISAFVLPLFWGSAQPSYQGQSLSHWLEKYHSALANGKSLEAEEAIRQIGTNALPTLIRMLRARDSDLKRAVMKWSAKQNLIKFNLTPATQLRYYAQAGYNILGPAAATQVPELTLILKSNNVAQVRQCAAAALGSIGDQARPAVPVLLVAAKDQDQLVRNNSLWALSRIHADPDLVLPALIAGLDDSYSVARENAAIALGRYGPIATSAIPALVRTMPTNRAAHSALLQIDPDAASREAAK